MKAAIMKCSILLLLILFFNVAHAEKSEAERRIQKEFVVKADGFLSVDNRYGKIDIAIGESNQIKMEVVIKVRAGFLNPEIVFQLPQVFHQHPAGPRGLTAVM